MYTIKSHCNPKKLFSFTLILCIIFCSLLGTDAFAETGENKIIDTHAVPIPINDYILVTMEHEYSFPEEDYEASYFGKEYVKKVEAIFTYQEGDLADPDTFLRIEKLYLTEYGKENIDAFIELLKKRDDIFAAEKDYLFPNVSAAEDLSELNEIPEGAIPIDEYILVSMEHEYSFPKEDYGPSYFGKEYVKIVEAIFTYQEGDLVNPDTFLRIEKLYLTDYGKENIDTFIELLSKREDIAVAEKDYLCPNVSAAVTPNDPYLSFQYAIDNMLSKKAWAIVTGAQSMRIGIIDSGINSSHEDLNVNTSLSRNYVTTDNEGLADALGHGTIVAGVASASGNNNIGICGVAWRSTLINLRVIDSTDYAANNSIVSAVDYAKNNNISIINMSLQNLSYSASLRNALNTYTGVCIVSAGNNHGSSLTYPAKYNLPCMIVVAATNQSDTLLSNSDYHSTKVHLAAPGGGIYTTNKNLSYSYYSGTSLAAPQVTGTVALIRSVNINLTSAQIKAKLLEAVDSISGLSGMVSTGGRLNTFRAVRLAKGYLMGDSNFDGVIDSTDSRQVHRWSVGLDNCTDLNEALCDVNYDNSITAADARLVLRMAVGLIDPIQ